jgi:hypothetical protein
MMHAYAISDQEMRILDPFIRRNRAKRAIMLRQMLTRLAAQGDRVALLALIEIQTDSPYDFPRPLNPKVG